MDCNEFERWLDEGMPGDEASRGAAERHAASCQGCAEAAGAARTLEALLAAPAASAPSGFAGRVMERVVLGTRTGHRTARIPALPAMPVLDTTPPVDTNCAFAPKWMERYCPLDITDLGTTLDWTNFFWLLWSNGPDRYSVDEISDVWESNSLGTWMSLETTVNALFAEQDKRDQFIDKGGDTGVDNK